MALVYAVDAKGVVYSIATAPTDLSNLNATNLTSGTVPLARLSGITNAQIAAAAAIAYSKLALSGSIVNADVATAAAIAYSKLTLTGSIVDADVNAAAAIAWTKLSKSGSSLADLATRSAADLTSGTLPVARLVNGVTTIATTTSTGAQADFAPGLSGDTLIRCNNASDLTISGIAGGVDGQIITFYSIGAGNVFFKHQSALSVAGNRFINRVTSGDTPIAAGVGSATYQYDATTARWRLIQHEQGGFIAVAYAGGNFTGGGTQTWTVDSGDVNTYSYFLIGRVLMLNIYLSTTSVGGTPDPHLYVTMPNSYSAATIGVAFAQSIDNGSTAVGLIDWAANDLKIGVRNSLSIANWAASANNSYVRTFLTLGVN